MASAGRGAPAPSALTEAMRPSSIVTVTFSAQPSGRRARLAWIGVISASIRLSPISCAHGGREIAPDHFFDVRAADYDAGGEKGRSGTAGICYANREPGVRGS